MKEKIDSGTGIVTAVESVPLKLTDCDIFKENPFINDCFVDHVGSYSKSKAARFKTENGVHLITRDGEQIPMDNHVYVASQFSVDSEEFAKIFQSSMRGIGLGKVSSAILMHIASILGKNDVTVFLDVEEMTELLDISKPTYYNALFELVNAKVLARSKVSYKFFVNPLFIFNGNRLTIVKDYIRKNSDQYKELPDSKRDNDDLNAFDGSDDSDHTAEDFSDDFDV
jgi:hypothetical protein